MDLDYLENRPAGLPSDECFLSIPKASMLYRATETALPWVPTSNGEAARAMIPLLDLMEVWDRAPIDDDFITWTVANGYGSMTTCVHVNFLDGAFSFAEAQHLFADAAGDLVEYESKADLRKAVRELIAAHPDDSHAACARPTSVCLLSHRRPLAPPCLYGGFLCGRGRALNIWSLLNMTLHYMYTSRGDQHLGRSPR